MKFCQKYVNSKRNNSKFYSNFTLGDEYVILAIIKTPLPLLINTKNSLYVY